MKIYKGKRKYVCVFVCLFIYRYIYIFPLLSFRVKDSNIFILRLPPYKACTPL